MAHNKKALTMNQLFHVPLIMPLEIRQWFALLERRFEALSITDDVIKSAVLLETIEPEYLQRIENILTNPPATGLYNKLKDEVTVILAEVDLKRIIKLIESEVMGDRNPSQFYHDLDKKFFSPFASDQFILTIWRSRLPDHITEVLTAVHEDTEVETLLRIADKVQEVFSRNSQCASRVSATNHPVQDVAISDDVAAAINSLSDRLLQMQVKIDKLINGKYRRNRSRSSESQQQGKLCFYHVKYRERATKCISPCAWK